MADRKWSADDSECCRKLDTVLRVFSIFWNDCCSSGIDGGCGVVLSSLTVALPPSSAGANDVAVREDSEREMLSAVRPCRSSLSLPVAMLPVGECVGETCTDDICRAAAMPVELPVDGPFLDRQGEAAAAGVVRLRR